MKNEEEIINALRALRAALDSGKLAEHSENVVYFSACTLAWILELPDVIGGQRVCASGMEKLIRDFG
jgi:hypothetical protein